MTRPTLFGSLLLALGCVCACGERKPAADAAVSPPSPPPATPPPAPLAEDQPPSSPDARPCPRETGLISDAEFNSIRGNVLEGRGGYWYTYSDKEGTEVTPRAGDQGGTFVTAKGGANGTSYAARMSGKTGTAQLVYAGMGLNITDPRSEYDARKYKGISFWMKKGSADSPSIVRVKLPDRNTDPQGKQCTECFNDFGEYLEVTPNWKKYYVTFAAMKQQSDWGKPRPPSIASEALYAIQFQVDDYSKKFDIWVDELEFTGCAP